MAVDMHFLEVSDMFLAHWRGRQIVNQAFDKGFELVIPIEVCWSENAPTTACWMQSPPNAQVREVDPIRLFSHHWPLNQLSTQLGQDKLVAEIGMDMLHPNPPKNQYKEAFYI